MGVIDYEQVQAWAAVWRHSSSRNTTLSAPSRAAAATPPRSKSPAPGKCQVPGAGGGGT